VGTDSAEKLIEIGVVGRPHGINGGVRVFLHNPDSATIVEAPRLFLKQSDGVHETTLSDLRPGNKCHLARFEGVVNRTGAEALKGARILVPRSAFPPPKADEFYVADLIDLVAYVEGVEVGRVASSRPQGGIEVLRIVGDREEFEVPLVDDFVSELDISGGRVLLRNVEDLPRSRVHSKFKK